MSYTKARDGDPSRYERPPGPDAHWRAHAAAAVRARAESDRSSGLGSHRSGDWIEQSARQMDGQYDARGERDRREAQAAAAGRDPVTGQRPQRWLEKMAPAFRDEPVRRPDPPQEKSPYGLLFAREHHAARMREEDAQQRGRDGWLGRIDRKIQGGIDEVRAKVAEREDRQDAALADDYLDMLESGKGRMPRVQHEPGLPRYIAAERRNRAEEKALARLVPDVLRRAGEPWAVWRQRQRDEVVERFDLAPSEYREQVLFLEPRERQSGGGYYANDQDEDDDGRWDAA